MTIINELFSLGWAGQDCLLCGGAETEAIVCPACAQDLPRLPEPHCPGCALPLADAEAERCGRCLTQPPAFDRTHAVFRYAYPVDKLIHAFKYGHRLALAGWFSRCLATAAAGIDADLVLPLPLHRERLRQRGFNQALEISRRLPGNLTLAIDLCRRIRDTPAQSGLPWAERQSNVRGAFHCTADLSGKRVIVVDDVMTTGATLGECVRTLKLHGAAQVTLLVLARALPPAHS